MGREPVREREPVHQEDKHYEDILRLTKEARERARKGKTSPGARTGRG